MNKNLTQIKMTTEERKSAIEWLKQQLECKKREYELLKTFPSQLIRLSNPSMFLLAHDNLEEFQKVISKLNKQIELFNNSAVESMSPEEFKAYIKSADE